MLITGKVILLKQDGDFTIFRLEHQAASFRIENVSLKLGQEIKLEVPDSMEASLRDGSTVVQNASITKSNKLAKPVRATSHVPVRSGEG